MATEPLRPRLEATASPAGGDRILAGFSDLGALAEVMRRPVAGAMLGLVRSNKGVNPKSKE
jgi:hypothetical protein